MIGGGAAALLQTSTPLKTHIRDARNDDTFQHIRFSHPSGMQSFSQMGPGVSKTQPLATIFDASGVTGIPKYVETPRAKLQPGALRVPFSVEQQTLRDTIDQTQSGRQVVMINETQLLLGLVFDPVPS